MLLSGNCFWKKSKIVKKNMYHSLAKSKNMLNI